MNLISYSWEDPRIRSSKLISFIPGLTECQSGDRKLMSKKGTQRRKSPIYWIEILECFLLIYVGLNPVFFPRNSIINWLNVKMLDQDIEMRTSSDVKPMN
jgi:hypothetical protein